jgi:Tol biopolymer transport system component
MVVSIDRTNGTALHTVLVGSTPTDLEIDAAGTFIYTGHSDSYAVAQIDAASLTFVKFIPTPQDSYDIVPIGSDRIASIDEDQSNQPAVLDIASGAVVSSLAWWDNVSEGALFASTDGKSLFIGEAGSTGSNIFLFDVSGEAFEIVTTSRYGASGYNAPFRSVVGTPDGSIIYYAGYCLDGTNLRTTRYAQTDRILSVTPDGKLAISETKVYRVSDGAALATFPAACPIQAVAPDSSAVYCAGTTGITIHIVAGLQ